MGADFPTPPASASHDLIEGLAALSGGEAGALQRLLPLVYAQLRTMAAERMRSERAGHTLQPTALVHEAFMRLGNGRVDCRDEGHFLAVAARAMREVLIDHARTHGRLKRGGDRDGVRVDAGELVAPHGQIDVIELDEALARLAMHDELGARVVEMRFFAGMEVDRIADVLGVTDRTIRRRWVYAKAWLMREMGGEPRGIIPDAGGAP